MVSNRLFFILHKFFVLHGFVARTKKLGFHEKIVDLTP